LKGVFIVKKVFCAFIGFLTLLSITASSVLAESAQKDYSHLNGTTINVYNWGEYISDGSEGSLDVNAEFTKKYGITVNYTNYTSNENLYNKLVGGGANYDVIIPSDYTIDRLIQEEMLLPLDFSNIPNYSYILDDYKNLYFDPENKYSIPYTVGMVGLIYNTKMVDEELTSWNDMWNEKYSKKILMFDNPRDAFSIAQFILGQDVNSKNSEDWEAAAELLKKQKPLISSYVMDEIFNKMERGDAAIAPYYAGDFLSMVEVNPDLAFIYPKEGTNFFVDSMCIPKGAQNKEAAELYINFMLSTDIAVANANYICYASPNRTVLESDDYELKGNKILYPSNLDSYNTQMFTKLDPDTQSLMASLWNDVKIEGRKYYDVYIGLAVASAAILVLIVYSGIKKKRRAADY